MARGIRHADVCIICALEEEADAVEQEISERCKVMFATSAADDDRFVYRSATITNNKQEPLTLLLLCQTHPGPVSAALDLGTQLQLFQPCFVGMSGICAGDKRHLHLGDLVVAEHAYHFEEGKVTRDESGQLIHQPAGITYGPAPHILRYVRTFGAWKTPVAELKKLAFNTAEPPRCVIALMASGMAVHSDDPFEALQRQHRKTWTLDMEAAAFYFALRAFPGIDGLVVKGVCDYADLAKDDAFHNFAARASAIYLLTFIQEYVTTDMLRRSRTLSVFTVPFRRNPYFTGRQDILKQLHTHLAREGVAVITQPYAISGLGGIGKTQVAVEYSYRYQSEYHTVLWVNADTPENILVDVAKLAEELQLPEHREQDQMRVMNGFKRWLKNNEHWLLILDNADDLSLVEGLPPVQSKGDTLITTRTQNVGRRARKIELEVMEMDVGALFLLRRAGMLEVEQTLEEAVVADQEIAREIVKEMGGLPLALEQAGAYIEATGCRLEAYLQLCKERMSELLQEEDLLPLDYPRPAMATWSLAFQRVESVNPAAADLLNLCAFLAPDTIPEEIFAKGAQELGPLLKEIGSDPHKFNKAIKLLRTYSLITRNTEPTLTIHRLVQVALQRSLTEEEQKSWAERTVKAINKELPKVEYETTSQYQRYIQHGLQCEKWISQWGMMSEEAARLCNQAGWFLASQFQFELAESLLQRAVHIRERVLGEEHPDTATSLNNLAFLYRYQGKYGLAEPLYQRALHICEQVLGAEHPDTARSLNSLAFLYYNQGKYELAEPLYQRGLHICEQALGKEHPNTASSLNNLANLYNSQGKYELAEPLYQRSLHIREQVLGEEHPNTAIGLSGLALLYRNQGKFELAEPLFRRALSIREQVLGAENPNTARSLSDLAGLYDSHGKYAEAEPLYQRSWRIFEKTLGEEHPTTVQVKKSYDDLRLRMKNKQ